MFKNELYENTVKRLARGGITDPTSIIVFLAEEIEQYRDKIHVLEAVVDDLQKLLIEEKKRENKEEMMFYILERLPRQELLAQLAEEADELGHAALKMRRAIDGRNPTPVTLEETQEMLEEEAADVMLCFLLLGIDWNDPAFGNRVAHKMTRWIGRLQEVERKCDNQVSNSITKTAG